MTLENKHELAQEVLSILETIRVGEVDPLDYQLVEAYRRLQKLILETEDKLQIDEMLNEVLDSKVLRIQELARIMSSPELYVEKLKEFKAKELARLTVYQHPIVLHQLNYDSLSRSFLKVSNLIDSLQSLIPEEPTPSTSTLPSDFRFHSEDPLLLENLKKFSATLPKKKSVRIEQILNCSEFEEFLRRFLYVVLMISKGMIVYNPKNKEVRRV
jgi:hypothetical protein